MIVNSYSPKALMFNSIACNDFFVNEIVHTCVKFSRFHFFLNEKFIIIVTFVML